MAKVILFCFVAVATLSMPPSAFAVVVASDFFDDGDRDNDGITDDGNETPVGVNDGINWYAISGQTSFGNQKPTATVLDDSTGIGSGNALFIEARGSSNEIMGVLDSTVSLGNVLGSTLTVTFDIRMQDLLLPSSGEFRFGLYADTDNEFGTASTNNDGSPTVWAGSDGFFDRQSPGALGDLGVFTRTQLGSSGALDGGQTRIIEEANANTIMGGSGDGDQVNRADPGTFGVINNNSKYSFELELERVAPSPTGETVMMTLSMTDSSAVTSVLSGLDGAVGSSGNDTFAAGDTFDYFVAMTTVDTDWVFDNFQLEVVEGVGLPGDFNGDGSVNAADYTVWRDNEGAGDESALNGNGDGINGIDAGDYSLWVTNFGSGASSGNGLAIPEPGTVALLLLSVFGSFASCQRNR